MLGGVGQLMRPSLVGGDYYVAPGILLPPFTLTRSQAAGVQSTALASNGTTWKTYAADIERFNGTAQRLLIEGQRTNNVRNPRVEGAVAGTPGTLPTNWSIQSDPGGTRTLTPETRNGIPGVRVQYSGNATASAALQIRLEVPNTIAALSGQTWTGSFFYQLDTMTGYGGSPSISCRVEERDAAGVFLTAGATSNTAVPAGFQRLSHTRTLNNASTAFATLVLGTTSATSGQPVSLDLWLGGGQLEQATFASTPILPPVGSPAASTRGADLISATLASLGIGANGACTVLWSGVIPQAAPAATFPAAINISDGTANNRFTLFQNASSNDFILARVNGGASATSATVGTQTPGTPFPIGLTINGSGGGSACFNGGTVRTVSGGVTSGLTTFAIGTGSLFGEVARLSVLPYALSDAALQAAVAAFPTS